MLHQPFLHKRYLSFHNIKQLEKKININIKKERVNTRVNKRRHNRVWIESDVNSYMNEEKGMTCTQ